tara:strand:- start:769 stop:1776 length:1008 start_codon:yes stop_codon:yes gene_type:complete
VKDKHKYRLTFNSPNPGFFRFDEASLTFKLDEYSEIEIKARDAGKLVDATKFHIESGGFLDKASAIQAGENLRSSLRMTNCMLDLGLNIPIKDSTSGSVSDAIKLEAAKTGGVVLDTIVGLRIYPDDGAHFEYVMAGRANVFPSDPYYALEGLKRLWVLNLKYDQKTNDVLEILHAAGREKSSKAKFLTTYLGLELLIERSPRSDNAKKAIDELLKKLLEFKLTESELTSIKSSISNVRKYESFGTAFRNLVSRIENPSDFAGMPISDFVSKCISTRNAIAHKATLDPKINLDQLTKGMREFSMQMIWTKNGFPGVSLEIPASSIQMEKFETRVM